MSYSRASPLGDQSGSLALGHFQVATRFRQENRGHLGHLDELFPVWLEIQLQQLDCLRGSWFSLSLLANDQARCDAVPVRVGHNKMARIAHAFCLERFYRRRNRDLNAPKKDKRFLGTRPATETLMGVAFGL